MKYAKIIYTVLLVSLAVNFFVAGALFTHFNRPGVHKPLGGTEQFNMEAARDALSPNYRPVVDKIWREFKAAEKPKFQHMFELRRKVQEILLAEEFDPTAFEALSLRMQKSGNIMRVTLQTVLTKVATALPDEERKKYFRAGFEFSRIDQREHPPRRRPEG
jgi:uncharacterized membrane protein